VARSISEELQKDCRMEYTLNARSIVANLTRDHRRRLLRAILVSEYGQRIHPVTGEIPLNLFNKHDMDGDGVLSKYVAPIRPPAPVVVGGAMVYVLGAPSSFSPMRTAQARVRRCRHRRAWMGDGRGDPTAAAGQHTRGR
jgi:hypothetical protein